MGFAPAGRLISPSPLPRLWPPTSRTKAPQPWLPQPLGICRKPSRARTAALSTGEPGPRGAASRVSDLWSQAGSVPSVKAALSTLKYLPAVPLFCPCLKSLERKFCGFVLSSKALVTDGLFSAIGLGGTAGGWAWGHTVPERPFLNCFPRIPVFAAVWFAVPSCRWKIHEACMLALGSVKSIITDSVKNGRVHFDMHGFLTGVILADLNLSGMSRHGAGPLEDFRPGVTSLRCPLR